MIENKGKAAFSAKVYLEHVLAKYVSKNANEVTSFLNFIANYGHDVTRDVMQVAAAHKASAVAIPFMSNLAERGDFKSWKLAMELAETSLTPRAYKQVAAIRWIDVWAGGYMWISSENKARPTDNLSLDELKEIRHIDKTLKTKIKVEDSKNSPQPSRLLLGLNALAKRLSEEGDAGRKELACWSAEIKFAACLELVMSELMVKPAGSLLSLLESAPISVRQVEWDQRDKWKSLTEMDLLNPRVPGMKHECIPFAPLMMDELFVLTENMLNKTTAFDVSEPKKSLLKGFVLRQVFEHAIDNKKTMDRWWVVYDSLEPAAQKAVKAALTSDEPRCMFDKAHASKAFLERLLTQQVPSVKREKNKNAVL